MFCRIKPRGCSSHDIFETSQRQQLLLFSFLYVHCLYCYAVARSCSRLDRQGKKHSKEYLTLLADSSQCIGNSYNTDTKEMPPYWEEEQECTRIVECALQRTFVMSMQCKF